MRSPMLLRIERPAKRRAAILEVIDIACYVLLTCLAFFTWFVLP